jgi:hypothetical protein
MCDYGTGKVNKKARTNVSGLASQCNAQHFSKPNSTFDTWTNNNTSQVEYEEFAENSVHS